MGRCRTLGVLLSILLIGLCAGCAGEEESEVVVSNLLPSVTTFVVEPQTLQSTRSEICDKNVCAPNQ